MGWVDGWMDGWMGIETEDQNQRGCKEQGFHQQASFPMHALPLTNRMLGAKQ